MAQLPATAATIVKQRPKYLSLQALLFEIRLPLSAWVSILHRISGILLFGAMLWLLYLLDRSLASQAGFDAIRAYLGFPSVKLALLILAWAFLHHFCAGIRYLLLDLHKGVDLASSRRSSAAVLVISVLLTIVVGVKLW